MALRLYSRHACHLCEVMQAELQSLLEEFAVELIIADVDSRIEWQQEYGSRVPVLETAEGRLLCQYHLDEALVREWLSSERAKSVC